MANITTRKTDILILGAGGAGLFAALHAKKAAPDLTVTIAVKGLLGKCGCTRMVQGGYNVALSPGDSIERHFMDTIEGGKWLPNQKMAWRLCETAVERVQELENELGCFFDRNPDGSLHHKAFAGQTFDRTVHKGDLTGIEIISRLMEQVMALPIQRLEDYRALALIKDREGSRIAGVLMVNMRDGAYEMISAKSVLLATGGGPTMYRYHTPSGDKTMDGLAMALDLGLTLRDMEMVQFHPTGLLGGMQTRMTGTVLEEGLRGAGGHLLGGDGQRFMFDYDDRGERATRDIVSRGIYAEMQKGNVTKNGGVYIFMHHLGPDNVAKKFPGMVKRCADCGFDLAGGMVEVVPTAHYFMGGVVCNESCQTELEGLLVAGEDAGGAHGANRLGGNGVANSTVFGGIAGDQLALLAKNQTTCPEPDSHQIDHAISIFEKPFANPQNSTVHLLLESLQHTMWNDVGIVRDAQKLQNGLKKIRQINSEVDSVGIATNDRSFNIAWHDWINLRSLVKISEAITLASLERENSRGAHFRQDFPDAGNLETSYFTTLQQTNGNMLNTGRTAVSFDLVKPGQSLIKS